MDDAATIALCRDRLLEVRKLIAKVEAPGVIAADEDIASLREEERILLETIRLAEAG